MEENKMSGGYPDYIPRELIPKPKKVYSFRVEQEDLEDLKQYANLKGIEPSRVLNNILHEFLADKVLEAEFIQDKIGFVLPLPTDLKLKKKLIHKDITMFMDDEYFREWLMSNTENKLVGTASYETSQIPNNLDLWNGDTFESTLEGIDHEGVLAVIVPEIYRDNYEVSAEDLIYFLDIEVISDQYRVTPILSVTAINKLRLKHRLEIVALIEEIMMRLDEVLEEYGQDRDKCYKDLRALAKLYNMGNIIAQDIELEATVTSSDSRQYILDCIMESEAVQGMADEIMANKDIMSKIQQLLNEK